MIIKNFVIGKDNTGKELQCGDICDFEVRLQRRNNLKNDEPEIMRGMIVYDEDSYAFAFETLDDFAPLLCMYTAEYGSIKKVYDVDKDNYYNIPNGAEWRDMYIRNASVWPLGEN